FDLARTEYHRHLGRSRLDDVDFAMRATTVEYLAPARFDDLLEVFVRVARIGTTSITYDHAAYRIDEESGDDDTLMVTSSATLVCISLTERRAVPVPAAFRAAVAGLAALPGGALRPPGLSLTGRTALPITPCSPVQVLGERRSNGYPSIEVPPPERHDHSKEGSQL